MSSIDLNSDLGEGFGPWRMGDDAAILNVVTSANIACGGHAGDPATMVATLRDACQKRVVPGAHPGYADREGFGRRLIPLSLTEIEQLIATQLGALMGAGALAGTSVRYIKPHGALGNVAADNKDVALAIARAAKAVQPTIAVLAISGTEMEHAARDLDLEVFSEIFADRGYLETGRLVPRGQEGAMISDPKAASTRLLEYLDSGKMATVSGKRIALDAHSICVHGDSPGALEMARNLRADLEDAGIVIKPFLSAA